MLQPRYDFCIQHPYFWKPIPLNQLSEEQKHNFMHAYKYDMNLMRVHQFTGVDEVNLGHEFSIDLLLDLSALDTAVSVDDDPTTGFYQYGHLFNGELQSFFRFLIEENPSCLLIMEEQDVISATVPVDLNPDTEEIEEIAYVNENRVMLFFNYYEGVVKSVAVRRPYSTSANFLDKIYITLVLTTRLNTLNYGEKYALYARPMENDIALAGTSGLTFKEVISSVLEAEENNWTRGLDYQYDLASYINYKGEALTYGRLINNQYGSDFASIYTVLESYELTETSILSALTLIAEYIKSNPGQAAFVEDFAQWPPEQVVAKQRMRIQYGETDYDFIQRLCEREGVNVYTDCIEYAVTKINSTDMGETTNPDEGNDTGNSEETYSANEFEVVTIVDDRYEGHYNDSRWSFYVTNIYSSDEDYDKLPTNHTKNSERVTYRLMDRVGVEEDGSEIVASKNITRYNVSFPMYNNQPMTPTDEMPEGRLKDDLKYFAGLMRDGNGQAIGQGTFYRNCMIFTDKENNTLREMSPMVSEQDFTIDVENANNIIWTNYVTLFYPSVRDPNKVDPRLIHLRDALDIVVKNSSRSFSVTIANYSEYTDNSGITDDFAPIASTAYSIQDEEGRSYIYLPGADPSETAPDGILRSGASLGRGTIRYYGETLTNKQDAFRISQRRVQMLHSNENLASSTSHMIDMRAGCFVFMFDRALERYLGIEPGSTVETRKGLYITKVEHQGIALSYNPVIPYRNSFDQLQVVGGTLSHNNTRTENAVFRTPIRTPIPNIKVPIIGRISSAADPMDDYFVNETAYKTVRKEYPNIDAQGRYWVRLGMHNRFHFWRYRDVLAKIKLIDTIINQVKNNVDPNNPVDTTPIGTLYGYYFEKIDFEGLTDKQNEDVQKYFINWLEGWKINLYDEYTHLASFDSQTDTTVPLRRVEFFADGLDESGFGLSLQPGTEVVVKFTNGNPDMPYISGVRPRNKKSSELTKRLASKQSSYIRTAGGAGVYLVDEIDNEKLIFETDSVDLSLVGTGVDPEYYNSLSATADPQEAVSIEPPDLPADGTYRGSNYIDISGNINKGSNGLFKNAYGIRMGTKGVYDLGVVGGIQSTVVTKDHYYKIIERAGGVSKALTPMPITTADFREKLKDPDGYKPKYKFTFNNETIANHIFTFHTYNTIDTDETRIDQYIPDKRMSPVVATIETQIEGGSAGTGEADDSNKGIEEPEIADNAGAIRATGATGDAQLEVSYLEGGVGDTAGTFIRELGTKYTYRQGNDYTFASSGLRIYNFGSTYDEYHIGDTIPSDSELKQYDGNLKSFKIKLDSSGFTQYTLPEEEAFDMSNYMDFGEATSGTADYVSVKRYFGNKVDLIDADSSQYIMGDSVTYVDKGFYHTVDGKIDVTISDNVTVNVDNLFELHQAQTKDHIIWQLGDYSRFMNYTRSIHFMFSMDMALFMFVTMYSETIGALCSIEFMGDTRYIAMGSLITITGQKFGNDLGEDTIGSVHFGNFKDEMKKGGKELGKSVMDGLSMPISMWKGAINVRKCSVKIDSTTSTTAN